MCCACDRGHNLNGMVGPGPVASTQVRIAILAFQTRRVRGCWAVQGGEGAGQQVEPAAQNLHVGGVGRIVVEGAWTRCRCFRMDATEVQGSDRFGDAAAEVTDDGERIVEGDQCVRWRTAIHARFYR